MKPMTGEEVINVLRSISELKLVHHQEYDDLEVKFNDRGDEVFIPAEYRSGTFTRELLILIQEAMEGGLDG